MRTRNARRLVAGLTLVGLVTVSGCELAGASNAPAEPERGGTVIVHVQGGLDILDPQRTYAAGEMDVLRLTTRTLTTYRAEAGAAGSEIVPDLATDTGRPSDDNTVWTFKLKPNVKWEGGEPVTCSQVKYGIERRFSSIIDGGPTYPMDYLKDNATPYQGPWIGGNNGGKGLESIECTDEFNIVFHLSRPVGDFGYTVALSTFAPVLPEKDTKDGYAKRPYSNGPYKVEGELTQDGLTLVRNNFWTASNDQVRKAYPDRFVFDFRPDDSGVITNEVIQDQGDARNMVMLDSNVSANFLQQVVNDPELINRAIVGSTGGVRYIAINTKAVPNLACRQALIYPFNKRKWRAASGGSVTGDYATSMIPVGIRAHKDFDLFDTIANPEGDPDKSIAIMEEQAKTDTPCDATVTFAYRDSPLQRRLANTVVEAYQLAGIQVTPLALDPATYYHSGIGDATNNYHMMVAGWIPDWANGSAIIPPLFDGGSIPPVDVNGNANGNVNFSVLDDPKINEQIDTALGETSAERQYALWGDLDQQIQALAVTIPIVVEKAVRLTGSNILGGFIHPAYAMPDLCALGLARP